MTWGRYSVCLDPRRPYVVLDLETTGLSARRHQIIEIGALRIVPGQIRSSGITHLVRSARKLPPKIVTLTGITDDMLAAGGVDAGDALNALVNFVGRDPIVSFNTLFDLSFLNTECERHSITVLRRGGHSCALKLARRAWPGLGSYRLSDLAEVFKLDRSSEHRALGDAVRAAQIYQMASSCHRERLEELRLKREGYYALARAWLDAQAALRPGAPDK